MEEFMVFKLIIMGIMMASSLFAAWQQPPHLFPDEGESGEIRIASDAAGHAFAAFTDSTFLGGSVKVFYYDGTAWSAAPVFTSPLATVSFGDTIDLAMNPSGLALLIWTDNDGVGNTAYFDGTVWSIPPGNPLLGINVEKVAIDINEAGIGVAAWIDDVGNVSSSSFSGGAWNAPVNIGTGDFELSVAISQNGTAASGWQSNVTGVTVNNLFAGSWQLPQFLDPTGFFGVEKSVDLDANGKALAIWTTAAGVVVASTFNGSVWLVPQVLDPSPGSEFPTLLMAPGGTAVAVWINNASNGLSSSYNGSTWSTPIPFTLGPITLAPTVSVNSSGNALVGFRSGINFPRNLKSAFLPLGAAAFGPEELLQANPILAPNDPIRVSLSDNGTGFAAWTLVTEGEIQFYASVTAAPAPPLSMEGRTCKTSFATHVDKVNIITFTPSTDASIVSYLLRRDDILIATIPATGPFVYFDPNRCRNGTDVYSLTSVNASGQESTPVIIEL